MPGWLAGLHRGGRLAFASLAGRPQLGSVQPALAEDGVERAAHARALAILQDERLEPMVGGAYALRVHTGIWRDTKDLDLFIRKDAVVRALEVLARAGYRTEFTDRLWIAKAFAGPY